MVDTPGYRSMPFCRSGAGVGSFVLQALPGEHLWIGVSGDSLVSARFIGSFEDDALLEPGASSDEGDEV